MIESSYLYVLVALVYLQNYPKLTMEIFVISLLMIVVILSNVSSVVDLGFACVYGMLAMETKKKGE